MSSMVLEWVQGGDYVAAFRRVAGAMLRTAGLENVALVWDWSVDAELDAEHGGRRRRGMRGSGMRRFIRGTMWWIGGGEPVQRGEPDGGGDGGVSGGGGAAPVSGDDWGIGTARAWPVSEGQGAVDHWFGPYFALIRRSAGIKAFCYIDWDWRVYPQWAEWGDSRVQDDPAIVLGFYRAEVIGMPALCGCSGCARRR